MSTYGDTEGMEEYVILVKANKKEIIIFIRNMY